MNNASSSIGIQLDFLVYAFSYLCIPSSGMARCDGECVFTYLRRCHDVFLVSAPLYISLAMRS